MPKLIRWQTVLGDGVNRLFALVQFTTTKRIGQMDSAGGPFIPFALFDSGPRPMLGRRATDALTSSKLNAPGTYRKA